MNIAKRIAGVLVGGTIGAIAQFVVTAIFFGMIGIADDLTHDEFRLGLVTGLAFGCGAMIGSDVGAAIARRAAR